MTNQPAISEKKTPIYTASDTVFAWLCFLFGYLFCRTVPVFDNRLGGYLFKFIIFLVSFIILLIKKAKLPPLAIAVGISAVAVSASLIIAESNFLAFFSYSYALASYCYFVYAAFGNAMENGLSDFIFIDYFKSVFIMPFYSPAKIFTAIATKKSNSFLKTLLKILCGIAVAAIPTLIVFLLLSFDDGFTNILSKIFSFDILDIFSHIISILYAVPLGMYIFGLYAASSERRMENTITAEGCKKGVAAFRIMPKTTALTSALPIIFLYVVFFISQWKYYISGFTGVLPEDLSYAEYARDGFFQLCAVSVINLLIIIAAVLLTKREKKSCAVLRILTVVFCLCTLILISTAVAKLIMYINCYGLTPKRVYAMWMMAVIAIVFILIAIGQFAYRFKSVFTSMAVVVVMFAALSLCNVNGIIAEYNVDRYLDGTLDIVDPEVMEDLGDAAIPATVRLAREMSERGETVNEEIAELLEEKAEELEYGKEGIFSFTIPSKRAKDALAEYGITEK